MQDQILSTSQYCILANRIRDTDHEAAYPGFPTPTISLKGEDFVKCHAPPRDPPSLLNSKRTLPLDVPRPTLHDMTGSRAFASNIPKYEG